MTGRGRSRGRGAPSKEMPAPSPAATKPEAQPTVAASVPAPGRGRGRGRGAVAATPAAVAEPVREDGRGRGGGSGDAMAQVANGERSRGGGAIAPGKGAERSGADGLTDRMAGMRVSSAEQRSGAMRRRMTREEEENLSSGNFKPGFKINPATVNGPTLQLMTNAVMLTPPNATDEPIAHMYQVEFTPNIEGRKLRCGVLRRKQGVLGGPHYLFDGGASLYVGKKLDGGDVVEFSHTTDRGQEIGVRCTFRNNVYITSPEFHRIVAVLMKKGLSNLNYIPFGRHHFDPQSKISMKNGYELWPGYTTSVNAYEGGLMLVADTQFKLASVSTVYQEMREIYASAGSQEKFQQEALNKFVGRIVFTPYNQKRHRIDDIDFQAKPSDEFERRGEKVSFMQ